MLKIAVITQYFPISYQTWAGHSAYQTIRILAQRHEVKVFYPEASYPLALGMIGHTRRHYDPDYSPAGVKTQYIPYPAFPLLSRPLNGFQAGRRLLPHVKDFQPDIILSYVIYPDGFAALQVSRSLRVPMVVTAIGSDLNRISDPLCGIFTRKALRHADFVHTVSGHLLKTARRMGASAKRSEGLTNGCDTSVFYPMDKWVARNSLGHEESGSTVVYVGRLDVRKGLRELIEAAGYLRLQRPDFRCYIVGDGPDRAILAEAIARLGARDRIILIPSCTTQQVSLWMAAADLVTLPSYAEGCPNVVLEALASGRPVVASNVGGIPEIMDNRVGRLVPPRDVPALVKALGDVLDGKWNPAEIARQHRRSWSDVADEIENTLIRMHRAYSSS